MCHCQLVSFVHNCDDAVKNHNHRAPTAVYNTNECQIIDCSTAKIAHPNFILENFNWLFAFAGKKIIFLGANNASVFWRIQRIGFNIKPQLQWKPRPRDKIHRTASSLEKDHFIFETNKKIVVVYVEYISICKCKWKWYGRVAANTEMPFCNFGIFKLIR